MSSWGGTLSQRKGLPDDLIAFVQATQPEAWEQLREHHGGDLRDEFIRRVSSQVARRGLLSCLREGVKLTGQRIRLAYFRPVSGLNRELRTPYEGNLFSVIRQLRYSDRNENSLDLVLFLNGLPFFTAELKTPLKGQSVKNAIAQSVRPTRPGILHELILRGPTGCGWNSRPRPGSHCPPFP